MDDTFARTKIVTWLCECGNEDQRPRDARPVCMKCYKIMERKPCESEG